MQSEGDREIELPQPKTASGSPSAKPSDAQHTRGPWSCGPSGWQMADNYSQPFNVYQSGVPNLIAGCFGDVRGGPEVAEANARLIAAAPDLLAALKEAKKALQPIMTRADREVFQRVVAALSKAESQS